MLAPHSASLLDILKLMAPDSSTSTLRSWVAKGRILVNGKIAERTNLLVPQGSEVTLSPTVSFLKGGIKILYQDKDLVVIEKPHGLLSVATHFQKEETAHAYLKRNLKVAEIFPVHRLDRETSGLMLFALNADARTHFKQEFLERRVKKTYVAVCEGNLTPASGTWKSFLKEDAAYFVRAVEERSEGKEAITHYRVIQANPRFSLLDLNLETGRKNQLRVHCREAGHPITGDTKYGATSNPLKRLCLHAYHLAFQHPHLRKTLTFKIPPPPEFITITSK